MVVMLGAGKAPLVQTLSKALGADGVTRSNGWSGHDLHERTDDYSANTVWSMRRVAERSGFSTGQTRRVDTRAFRPV